MCAEAAYHLGYTMDGQEMLNQIRYRAGLDQINSTGAALLEAIYTERHLELPSLNVLLALAESIS